MWLLSYLLEELSVSHGITWLTQNFGFQKCKSFQLKCNTYFSLIPFLVRITSLEAISETSTLELLLTKENNYKVSIHYSEKLYFCVIPQN